VYHTPEYHNKMNTTSNINQDAFLNKQTDQNMINFTCTIFIIYIIYKFFYRSSKLSELKELNKHMNNISFELYKQSKLNEIKDQLNTLTNNINKKCV
jgi:hypothetical protein